MPDVSQVSQGTSGLFRSFDCFEPIRALEFCPLARNTERALIAAGGDTRVAIGQFLTTDVSYTDHNIVCWKYKATQEKENNSCSQTHSEIFKNPKFLQTQELRELQSTVQSQCTEHNL